MEAISRFFATRRGIVVAGAAIGILAPVLDKLANPGNMGICVACFERDIAGAIGLHRASVVQYIRPEIIGFVLGATVAARAFKEFKARTGSAPIVRFMLGMFAMIGALAFLGCPWRALLRLAGGDLNAILGLTGLTVGVTIGLQFLKSGYNLGRSRAAHTAVGWILPVIMARNAIKEAEFPIGVLVETVTSRENVRRASERMGCTVEVEEAGEEFRLILTK